MVVPFQMVMFTLSKVANVLGPVSYTHLDVYKRQGVDEAGVLEGADIVIQPHPFGVAGGGELAESQIESVNEWIEESLSLIHI